MSRNSIKLLLAITTCLLPINNALALPTEHSKTIPTQYRGRNSHQKLSWLGKTTSGIKYIFVDKFYGNVIKPIGIYPYNKIITEKNYKNPAVYLPTMIIGLMVLTYIYKRTVCNEFIAAQWTKFKNLFSKTNNQETTPTTINKQTNNNDDT